MSQPQLQVVPAAQRTLLDPANPIETAREFVRQRYTQNGMRLLQHHQSEFFRYRTTHYVTVSEEELRAALWAFLAG